MDVPLALAVVSDHPRPLCHLGIGGGDHPSLAGGHVLGGVEAEDPGVPDGPGPLAVILGAVGLAGVLNDQKVPLFSDLHDGVHVAREAAVRQGEDKIVAVRKDSPLVVGLAENGTFFASDVAPFLEWTKDVVYLENHDLVVADRAGVRFFDQDFAEVKRPVSTVELVFHELLFHNFASNKPAISEDGLRHSEPKPKM